MRAWTSLKRRLGQQLKGPWITSLLNVYPPYLGAGIRIRERGPLEFEVTMTLRTWNQNYLGTHFGGSLYSMCDPFFLLIVLRTLGRGYIAWDKSAAIRFRRPGRGKVTARFAVPRERIDALRAEVDSKGKADAQFRAEILDERGELVAEVEKVLQVRTAPERGG